MRIAIHSGEREQDRIWHAGKNVFGEGYRAVMGEMLTQGADYSHVPARRLVWLQAMMPLLKVPQAFCSSTSIMLGHALQTLLCRSIRTGDLGIMKARMLVLWSLCSVPGYPVSFWAFYSRCSWASTAVPFLPSAAIADGMPPCHWY